MRSKNPTVSRSVAADLVWDAIINSTEARTTQRSLARDTGLTVRQVRNGLKGINQYLAINQGVALLCPPDLGYQLAVTEGDTLEYEAFILRGIRTRLVRKYTGVALPAVQEFGSQKVIERQVQLKYTIREIDNLVKELDPDDKFVFNGQFA